VYQGVRTFSRRTLLATAERVLDVSNDGIGDDDDDDD